MGWVGGGALRNRWLALGSLVQSMTIIIRMSPIHPPRSMALCGENLGHLVMFSFLERPMNQSDSTTTGAMICHPLALRHGWVVVCGLSPIILPCG